MVQETGATFVILGHSERREDHGETNAQINAKVSAAAAAGLTPIVCVGESLDQRQAGEAEPFVRSQLLHSLPAGFAGIIAYEPIWAIGTGLTPTETDIIAMHAAIRAALVEQLGPPGSALRILYGAPSSPTTPPACWLCPKSAAPSSAAPACRRRISWPLPPPRRETRKPAPVIRFRVSMIKVLLVLHVFVTIALIGVVLIQRSEGGGLGLGGGQGMGNFMTGRGTANLLTRTTAILGTAFFVLSLGPWLSYISRAPPNRPPRSSRPAQNIPAPPAPSAPLPAPALPKTPVDALPAPAAPAPPAPGQ